MSSPLYIAIDLGAGSGRVFLAGVAPGELFLEEIRRFRYPPAKRNGLLSWDLSSIFGEICLGLREASVKANQLGRPVRSIGVDSWGVDYGLLDVKGDLIADPICYRDDRTTHAFDEVISIVPRDEIFERTGIQFQKFNTLYQLYSESEKLALAESLLLIPDLINYLLTGKLFAEYTNVTTTQMYSVGQADWDRELVVRLHLPVKLLQPIISPGTNLGQLKPEIEAESKLIGVNVIAPGTHDTASAVAAAPLDSGSAYISSGTWSLIGVENDSPLVNSDVERHNFTNEGGVFGTVRFLKNVMGLWIFESCRREWSSMGIDTGYDELLGQVAATEGFEAFIFPDDPAFLNPPSMSAAIALQLKETGQLSTDDPVAVSKIIFDSLAFRYASILRSIGSLTGRMIDNIQILGGGGRNGYLSQMTANASGLKCRAGLTEATVVGNVLVQAITYGQFSSLGEARRHVLKNHRFEEYSPVSSSDLDAAAIRYGIIEERF